MLVTMFWRIAAVSLSLVFTVTLDCITCHLPAPSISLLADGQKTPKTSSLTYHNALLIHLTAITVSSFTCLSFLRRHFSTAAMPPRTLPPWHALFSTHLSKHKSMTMSFASIDPSTATPRVRTLICRGLLGSIPPNPHTPLPHHNPSCYTSALPTFTTDIRSQKPAELSANNSVEVVFWIEETQNQWRLRGKCYLLSQDDTSAGGALEPWLIDTGRDGDKKKEWGWKKEVEAHFANMAPAMRGSFISPVPGTERMKGEQEGTKRGLSIKNEDVLSDDELVKGARKNFRVGVVVPEEVERLDLAAEEGWKICLAG